MPTDPARDALDRLLEAADSADFDTRMRALGVEVLGAFGSATLTAERRPTPGAPAHDLDIAVRFNGPVRLLELIDVLAECTGFDAFDVAVIDGHHPVLDAEALCGTPVYEATAGAFARAQIAALAHRRDTAFLRALDLAAMAE